ncbi:MAG: diadenosine tetraphosphatase [Proteobacteria bacterium HN_bin10]|nr:MAG: diadenosine tetraphosphatase [Proteobacteria bacterium HN_bin10]
MATYAIGDVQGCSAQLAQLVKKIGFVPGSDRLWFVGDLVNRGPDSLGVLRYVRSLGESARVVLGNHDLFLLAVSENVVALRAKDTIADVLKAEDRQELIDWLRHQPFHYRELSFFMVHAGLLPQWSAEEASQLAQEVETVLRGSDHRSFLDTLFHESVVTWNPALKGNTRLATIARALTRLRTCTPGGDTSSFSGPPQEAPPGYLPWFRVPARRNADTTIITGHWAALGLHIEPNLLALDSGCVWGRQLTAVRLEDRKVFQVEGLTRR